MCSRPRSRSRGFLFVRSSRLVAAAACLLPAARNQGRPIAACAANNPSQPCSPIYALLPPDGQARGFTLIALLTLALGIGDQRRHLLGQINIACLRPLALRTRELAASGAPPPTATWTRRISPTSASRYPRPADVLTDSSARRPHRHNVKAQGNRHEREACSVRKKFFTTLGVSPQLAAPFRPEEERAGGANVVDDFRPTNYGKKNYNSDRGAIGQGLDPRQRAYTIRLPAGLMYNFPSPARGFGPRGPFEQKGCPSTSGKRGSGYLIVNRPAQAGRKARQRSKSS